MNCPGDGQRLLCCGFRSILKLKAAGCTHQRNLMSSNNVSVP